MDLTKRNIKIALGIELDVELAGFFDVSKAAVSAWPLDEPLPLARQWQAATLRPDLFGRKAKRKPIRKPEKDGLTTSATTRGVTAAAASPEQ